jgi:hypothetical protein
MSLATWFSKDQLPVAGPEVVAPAGHMAQKKKITTARLWQHAFAQTSSGNGHAVKSALSHCMPSCM